VSDAGSGILLLFEEKSLKTGFESLIAKQALEQTHSVCLRAF